MRHQASFTLAPGCEELTELKNCQWLPIKIHDLGQPSNQVHNLFRDHSPMAENIALLLFKSVCNKCSTRHRLQLTHLLGFQGLSFKRHPLDLNHPQVLAPLSSLSQVIQKLCDAARGSWVRFPNTNLLAFGTHVRILDVVARPCILRFDGCAIIRHSAIATPIRAAQVVVLSVLFAQGLGQGDQRHHEKRSEPLHGDFDKRVTQRFWEA